MLLLAAPILSQVETLMLLWHLEFLDLHEIQFIVKSEISKKLLLLFLTTQYVKAITLNIVFCLKFYSVVPVLIHKSFQSLWLVWNEIRTRNLGKKISVHKFKWSKVRVWSVPSSAVMGFTYISTVQFFQSYIIYILL